MTLIDPGRVLELCGIKLMIDHAVNLIAQQLNQHLKRQFSSSDDLVIIGGLAEGKDQGPEISRNRLLLFVANIEQDTMRRGVDRHAVSTMTAKPQPIGLNISIMLASNFQAENYAHGLKVLSKAITYFQDHDNFTPENTPEMDKSITKLSLEICNLKIDDLSHLWAMIGRRYMPSILYLMRTVSIDAGALIREESLVTAPRTQVIGKAGAN